MTSGTLACEILAAFHRPQWEKETVPRTMRTFTALLAGINLNRVHGVFLGTATTRSRPDADIGLERLEVRAESSEAVEPREGIPFLVGEPFMRAGRLLFERALKPKPSNLVERECATTLGWAPKERPWCVEDGHWVTWTDLSAREQLLALAYHKGGLGLDLLRPEAEGRDPRLTKALLDDELANTIERERRRERQRLVHEDRAVLAVPVADGEPASTAIDRLAQTFYAILARLERRSAEVRARDAQPPSC